MNKQVVRAFIAAELPPSVTGRLEQIQNRLKVEIEGVRWVKASNIHLTITFLGDVEPVRIEPIAKAVREQTLHRTGMTFSLAGLGAFPGISRPRVIWVGLEGDGTALSNLYEDLTADLEVLGFLRERRSFTPHLTLGRVKSSGDAARGLKTIMGAEKFMVDGFPFTLDGLTLFRSDLTPRGALYTRLERFPFQGSESIC